MDRCIQKYKIDEYLKFRLENVGASGEDPDTDIEIWDSLVTECAGYKRQSCRFQVAKHLPDIR